MTRTSFVQWTRKAHGWIGLWGAALGLLFGTSGIWLNHRAVLQLPPVAQTRANSQIALPDPPPKDAKALGAWLQTALQLDSPPNNIRVEPARRVGWSERKGKGEGEGEGAGKSEGEGEALMQPEHWTVFFGGPHQQIQAETWVGNRSVSVRSTDNGLLATLQNLHKGVGMPVAWILLVDSLAGSIILLSISGLVLWLMTHRKRTVGLAIVGASLALTAGLAISRIA